MGMVSALKSLPQIIELVGKEEGERACKAVSALAVEARFADLVTLARELETRAEGASQRKLEAYELVVDHVEDQLALSPSDDAIDELFALSLASRERSVAVPRSRAVRFRAFGSRLGYGQTPKRFLAALGRHDANGDLRELLACWMHEVILRGADLTKEARATKLSEELLRSGHPLGGMPLALLPTEREVPSYMPLYGERGLGRAIDALTSGAMSIRSIPPPGDSAAIEAMAVVDEAACHRLGAAVRPWAEGKHGRVEAKIRKLSRKIPPSAFGRSVLRALALESTKDAKNLEVSRTGADGVFGPLFSAASNGGAYSAGVGGAYGRVAAWTTLGALVGAGETADVATIDGLAAASTFLVFRATGPWFHDVAWDLGAVALRPDGCTVAAIAATDME
jgi:hypothetical protein